MYSFFALHSSFPVNVNALLGCGYWVMGLFNVKRRKEGRKVLVRVFIKPSLWEKGT